MVKCLFFFSLLLSDSEFEKGAGSSAVEAAGVGEDCRSTKSGRAEEERVRNWVKVFFLDRLQLG